MRKIHANVMFWQYHGYLFDKTSGAPAANQLSKKEKLRPPWSESRSFFVPLILAINQNA